jgi:hypothetical protein
MSNEIQKAEQAAIVPVKALAADMEELRLALMENMSSGGITEFDLPKVTVPSGGATSWSINTLEGEVTVPELVGVIVFKRDTRTYYETSIEESGSGNPPTCSSTNGLIGIGRPGGSCIECPMAKFQGDEKPECGKGMDLFMLIGEECLPWRIQIPVSSTKPFGKFMIALTSSGVAYSKAVVRLKLHQETNAKKIKYSVVDYSFVRRLTAEEAVQAAQYTAIAAALCKRDEAPKTKG